MNNKFSKNFLEGSFILNKYKNDEFTICVVEISTISISNLNKIEKEDMQKLNSLGWNVGKNNDGGSFAEYSKLIYVDI